MKNLKLMVATIVIFLVTIYGVTVRASSFKFEASAEKEVFKPGESVQVSLNVDEIDAGKEGINVVEMSLEYDKSVFDSINFVKQNDWGYTYNDIENNERYGKLLYTNISNGVTDAECIGNITFKLKEDLPDMETEIKLLSVTSNDGKELIPVGDRIIKIRIINDKLEQEEPQPEEPEKPEQEEPQPEQPETPEQNVPQTPETPQTEQTHQENIVPEKPMDMIPQTGQTRIIYIVIGTVSVCALIALVVIAIISEKSKKKKNE